MRPAGRLLIAAAFGLTATACAFGTTLSPSQRTTLNTWLLCDDCAGREDAVAAIALRAVPALIKALLVGPSPQRRENMRRQIQASYARLADYLAPRLPSVSESAYVERFVDNYVATYQTRAAVALKRIGSPRARGALRTALGADSPARPDVLRALSDALGAALHRESLDNQFAPANSLVAAPPRVAVRDSTGRPLRNVRVTFAIDSGGGAVTDSVRYTDTSGMAAVGGWRLGSIPGRNTLRATAAGRVTRFGATATTP